MITTIQRVSIFILVLTLVLGTTAMASAPIVSGTGWVPIITDDFENGTFSAEWESTGNWEITEVDGTMAAYRNGSGTDLYKTCSYEKIKIKMRLKVMTNDATYPLGLNPYDGIYIYPLGMIDGKYYAWSGENGYYLISDSTYELGQWYDLEYYFDGQTGKYQIFMNGIDITDGGILATNAGVNATRQTAIYVYSGEMSGVSHVYIDSYEAYYYDENAITSEEIVLTSVTEANIMDIVTVDVNLNNITDVLAEDILLSYDEELLDYQGFIVPAGQRVWLEEIDSSTGELRVIIGSEGDENRIIDDKLIIQLKFKCINAGNVTVDALSARLANMDSEWNIQEAYCGSTTFDISGYADVNRSGSFSLIDFAISCFYYGENADVVDSSKYDADLDLNGEISDIDLQIVIDELILNNEYNPHI